LFLASLLNQIDEERKMKSKYLWLLIVSILMVSLVSACDQTAPLAVTVVETVEVEVVVTATPEAASEAPAAEGATTILRVGTGDSGEGLNPHQEIIAKFEEENPDVLVQLEAVAGRDYYARLLTQIAANDAPDIMQIGDDAVPQFVGSGAFLPLDDFISGSEGNAPLDPNIYLPGLLAPGQYQDQQWLLPKDYSPLAIYYNKKIFDEFGVDYPQDGWTWDEFLTTAQALTQDTDGDGKTDIWGIQLPGPGRTVLR
jgi:multiple sugar transport system substrate-binding protein